MNDCVDIKKQDILYDQVVIDSTHCVSIRFSYQKQISIERARASSQKINKVSST